MMWGPILSRLLRALFGGSISFLTDWLEGKANEKAVTEEQSTLDQKTAEAKADLARLDELNALKTTAATGVKAAEDKIAEDDQAVADTAAVADQAVDKVQAVPKVTGITGQEFDDKFKDL